MNWLTSLFGGARRMLAPRQRERLARWRALPRADLDRPHHRTRYVVVDVESSGPDPQHAALIALGAVAVVERSIVPHDAFSVVLRQVQPSAPANILLHGIGAESQRGGAEPVDALLDFLEFAGTAPLVAYHAFFDRAQIRRALAVHLGVRAPWQWLDLAWLLPELFPERIDRKATLDEWLASFGIGALSRHHALSDAYGTAQLLQIVLGRANAADAKTARQLAALEARRRRRLV